MDLPLNAFETWIQTHSADITYWVALSGGLDSSVLLHQLVQFRDRYQLTLKAFHVNHQISANAAMWATHCASLCDQYKVPLVSTNIVVAGKSLEAEARLKRYEVFKAHLKEGDVLLTAHHEEDQAETLFLQMIRGAGLKGLSAMPFSKPFGKGFQLRPFLSLSRSDLEHYARLHSLAWVQDESNDNIHFSRNYLRHTIMPLLKKRWPSVSKTFSRVSENCALAQQQLDESMQILLEKTKGSKPHTLSVSALRGYASLTRYHVIRAWLMELGLALPSKIKLQELDRMMLEAGTDKNPHLVYGDVEVRRFQDDLYAMNELPKPTEDIFLFDPKTPYRIPGVGILKAEEVVGEGIKAAIFSVRFRQGGEKIRLQGRTHHHDLKKLFQVWGVPPWERNRIPLLYVEDCLVGVPGYAVSAEFAADATEKGWRIELHPFDH